MKIKALITAAIVIAIYAGVWLWSSQSSGYANGQAAYDHTAAILACGPRPPESKGLTKAQAYISEELGKHGWSTIKHSFERDTPLGKKTFTNLIARYGVGSLDSIEALNKMPVKGILGAHLDSKLIPDIPNFLGADDAASACALIIELGNTLADKNPKMAKQLELVFFDGEEAFNKDMSLQTGDGLYGSRAYGIELYKRQPKPQFGIILDMVGHKNLTIAVPADSPQKLYNLMMHSAEKYDYQKHFSMAPGKILDDHYYLNKAGVPTIDIIGNFAHSHWWHKAGDDMQLISKKSLGISYKVTMNMLKELLK